MLVPRRGLVSIEAGCIDFCGTRTFYRIGCYVTEIATALYKNVAIRFYHTAALARECTVARSISTLQRRHHGTIGVAEIVILYKSARTARNAHAVFGYSIIIVVIYVHRHRTDTGVTRVGVVEPVVVIGYIVGTAF